jgi:hypothetical protein
VIDEAKRRATIARLNDHFRFTSEGGEMFMTQGVGALTLAEQIIILAEVRYFGEFTPDNDPHGEHDCAVLTVRGRKVIWKIDYFSAAEGVDPDPTSLSTCHRVLSIMLAEEY